MEIEELWSILSLPQLTSEAITISDESNTLGYGLDDRDLAFTASLTLFPPSLQSSYAILSKSDRKSFQANISTTSPLQSVVRPAFQRSVSLPSNSQLQTTPRSPRSRTNSIHGSSSAVKLVNPSPSSTLNRRKLSTTSPNHILLSQKGADNLNSTVADRFLSFYNLVLQMCSYIDRFQSD
jgi:hypothetical protein